MGLIGLNSLRQFDKLSFKGSHIAEQKLGMDLRTLMLTWLITSHKFLNMRKNSLDTELSWKTFFSNFQDNELYLKYSKHYSTCLLDAQWCIFFFGGGGEN